jgi:glycosyltransferase involved in cell wall biosynthesis
VIWHATDQEELLAIRHHFVNWRVQYVPVRFAPDTPRLLKQRTAYAKKPGLVRLVFISRITKKKGIHFLLELLARHPNERGQVVLDIYGPVVDDAYWRDCQALIGRMPAHCKVTYREAISHELVNETVVRYDFFILPTLGENFGHAIFESLSAGIPVMISDRTPWRELEIQQAGWDVPLEESIWTDVLAQGIQMDNQTYTHWSAQAVDVANTYIRDGQFEQSYRSLFS